MDKKVRAGEKWIRDQQVEHDRAVRALAKRQDDLMAEVDRRNEALVSRAQELDEKEATLVIRSAKCATLETELDKKSVELEEKAHELEERVYGLKERERTVGALEAKVQELQERVQETEEKVKSAPYKMVVRKLLQTSKFSDWLEEVTEGVEAWGRNSLLLQLMESCPQLLLKKSELGWDPECQDRLDLIQQRAQKTMPEFPFLTHLEAAQRAWSADEVEQLDIDYDSTLDEATRPVADEWVCEHDGLPFISVEDAPPKISQAASPTTEVPKSPAADPGDPELTLDIDDPSTCSELPESFGPIFANKDELTTLDPFEAVPLVD